MRILLSPLNWGLGHATRCVPIVRHLLRQGHEVVLASDGVARDFLLHYFPSLSCLEAPALRLRYAKGTSQVWAMLLQLPALLRHARQDYLWLKQLLEREHFDCVISDNRFGMYSSVKSVYITHQMMVKMPSGLCFLEPLAHALHMWVIQHYSECLIPDYASSPGLSGDLSHHYPLPSHARFIGPLSRFQNKELPPPNEQYDCVALLSGLEPHRSLMEQALIDQYQDKEEKLLILEGRPGCSPLFQGTHNVSICAHMPDEQLVTYLLGARRIVCRSGYSTLMDLDALGILHKAHLIATPGQTEQEYLALLHQGDKH